MSEPDRADRQNADEELAITVIGPDRPGIVADVAEALAGLGANLTDSTMTRLRGHFAMTLICTGPAAGEVEARSRRSPPTANVTTVRAVPPDGEPRRRRAVGVACTAPTGSGSSPR